MGKTGKNKKRRADAGAAKSTADVAIGDLCNVSGLDGGGEDVDDLFACMNEMDDEVEAGGGEGSDDDAGIDDGEAFAAGKPSEPKLKTYSMDEISLIPIRVELLRHKLMGELSSYLLDQVKGLRMPTFERWLIDTKLEEREKRKAGFNKLPPFDSVIPSAAEMDDGSTQRLIREICDFLSSSSSKYNEKDEDEQAEKICVELCRRSTEAAMEVHRMEMRLSTTGTALSFATKGRGGKRGKKKRKGKPNKERINLEKGVDGTYALVYKRRLAKKDRKAKQQSGEDDSGEDSEDEDNKNERATKSSSASRSFVVKINSSHYNKLRSMFDAIYPIQNPSTTHTFHHLVFTLLLRYSSLAGGHLLGTLIGGGMQGSINEKAFAFLGEFCASI